MASTPNLVEKFESKIPRVSQCCFVFDMTVGGTLLSVFGIFTSIFYLARSFLVLYSVEHFESELEDDDALNNDDDAIWLVYISTMCIGFIYLVVSVFMLYGSTKRMAHHVFPFLVGILLSTFWTFVLGLIEIFDSDMGLAAIYYAFGVLQIYLWVCSVSLYRDLLEIEKNPQKPTRTTV